MSDRQLLRRGGGTLVALLAYAGVAVGMTWPLAIRAGTHLLRGSGDTLLHYWNGWWAGQALSTGQSPFHTPYLFHPTGVSLVYHNFAWLNVGMGLVLRPWVGELAAYNLPLLINLALCGLAAYLLVRDVAGDGGAAFLAGLIYQCWPYRLSQLSHPNLISTQWIPLFLLYLVRAMRGGRWWEGVVAGVFAALTGYTRWQQLVPAAMVGGIYLVCTVPEGWVRRRRSVLVLLLAGGVAAALLAPPAWLLVREQRTTPTDLLVEEDEATTQTDLLAYVTPGASHPVLGAWTQAAYERYLAGRADAPFPAYAGVVALVLALVGVWKGRRAALPWAAMALVLLLLALGPVLRVNGRLYPGVPMPYRLAARLFVVRLLRFPARFNMFLALPVAVLAAYGAGPVLGLGRRRGRRAPAVLVCLLGTAILFEYLVAPIALERPWLSPFYAGLAAEPGDFAVLNLPIDPRKAKRYMFAQAVHHHPIMQGHTSRFPTGAYAYLDGHPWLRVLRQYSEMDPALSDVSRQLASLARDDVRYVILHKTYVDADRVAHWRRYLLTEPRFEDEQIAVYATVPQAGRDFTLMEELAPGIGPIRVVTSTGCLNAGRVLEVDVGWGTRAASGRELDVALALVAEGGAVAQAEVYPLRQAQGRLLSPAWPAQEWPANAVAWGHYPLRTLPSLSTGAYTVTLALVDAATGAPAGQAAVVGRVRVSASPCAFAAPADAVGVNAVFGDDLRLLGYRLRHDGDRLRLTLHWRSERRMEVDYKVFVHVFEPGTGVPVAQDDAMPHRWAYPTTFWGAGERVDDVIPISLGEVAAGVYGVAVGVYDGATMERLPVVDGAGQPQPDGRLVLPGETVRVE